MRSRTGDLDPEVSQVTLTMCTHLEEEQAMSVMRAISPRSVPRRGSAAYCSDPPLRHITKGRSYHPLPLSRWPGWLP